MAMTLYEWRNAPRQHGYSPGQLMFGRSQNTLLPQPPKAFSPIDLQQAARDKDKEKIKQLDMIKTSVCYPSSC